MLCGGATDQAAQTNYDTALRCQAARASQKSVHESAISHRHDRRTAWHPLKREDKPAITPTEFNDVARNIVSSMYAFSPSFYDSKTSGRNFAPIARAGVQYSS